MQHAQWKVPHPWLGSIPSALAPGVSPCCGTLLWCPIVVAPSAPSRRFKDVVQRLRAETSFFNCWCLGLTPVSHKKMESRHLYKVKLCTPPLNYRKSAIKSESTPPVAQAPSTKMYSRRLYKIRMHAPVEPPHFYKMPLYRMHPPFPRTQAELSNHLYKIVGLQTTSIQLIIESGEQ